MLIESGNNEGFHFEVSTPNVGEFEPKVQLASYLSSESISRSLNSVLDSGAKCKDSTRE